MFTRNQLCAPWNSNANNSTLVVSSPLYLKLAIKVGRKSRNSSISNITSLNSKARSQNKTFLDLAGLFSSIPSIFSSRRKAHKRQTSRQPSNNNSTPIISSNTTNEKSNSHSINGDSQETVNISAGKKGRNVFNIQLPPELSELVNSRRQDKPMAKNLTSSSTNPNIMFGKSQSLSAILSVMAAAVTLTILLHLLFFPLLFKKASVTYRTIQKLLGVTIKEKESPSPSKQRLMTSVSAKGTPANSSKTLANTNATPFAATPVSSDIEVTVIEEDSKSSSCIKPMDSEIVSPTILFTKREPQSAPIWGTPVPQSSSSLKTDFLSTSHCSTDHLDMCAIYKESNADGLVDPIDNPIHLEGKWQENSKKNGFVPNYDTVPEPRMGGSNDSDGLLCVYEQESYFVDDNPLCVEGPPELSRKLSKKLLFPSFMYNNPRIRHEEDEEKSLTTSADSEHHLDMSSVYEDSSFCKDDVNPLVIATSQLHANKDSVVPLSSGATTHSTDSNSTRLGRPKLFSPTFADAAAVLSPLKMKSKYPSFLLPSGRKSITRDEFDSCVPFDDDDDDSDDDYDDSSIHSFSFSTQTFSPHPPSTRESTETKGTSSLMMSFGVSPQIIIGGEAAPSSTPRANSLETVSTAPGSWIDCIQQEIVEPQSPAVAPASQLKRGGKLFVRPKATPEIGDLTPEQLRALSQLYHGNSSSNSNYDNTVHNIEGSSDYSSSKGIQRQPSQASSMNNSAHYYSTNRSADARSSAMSTNTYTNNILLSRASPPEVTNASKQLQHTRKYSQHSNGSNVSALSGSSGSTSFVSNVSKPIITAARLSSSGVISNKSSSVNSIPSSTAGADAMKAKFGGQKAAESSNLKSPEKSTPTSDFFRRCVSPYKAVSQFVRRTLSPSPTKRQQHNASHANDSRTGSPTHAPKGATHTNANTNTSSPAATSKGIAATATTHNHVISSLPTTATSKTGVAPTQRAAINITGATMTANSSHSNSITAPKVGMSSTYSGMYEKKKSFPGQSFPLSSAVVNSNLLKAGSSLVRKSSFTSSHSNSTPISRVPPLPASPPNTGATTTTSITATNSSSHNSPQRPLSGVKGNRVQ